MNSSKTTLPDGWRKEIQIRKKGKTKGREDLYYFTPDGVKLRSKNELKRYLINKKSTLTVSDFCDKKIIAKKTKESCNQGATKKASKLAGMQKKAAKGIKISAKKIPQAAALETREVRMESQIRLPKTGKRFASSSVARCVSTASGPRSKDVINSSAKKRKEERFNPLPSCSTRSSGAAEASTSMRSNQPSSSTRSSEAAEASTSSRSNEESKPTKKAGVFAKAWSYCMSNIVNR